MESKPKHWTTLDARLSSTRVGLAAAVVRDRYIVVAGGYNSAGGSLSTVDIIDTEAEGGPAVTLGPSLSEARCKHGMAVIGNRVYVVGGGYSSPNTLSSVEYLEFRTNEINSDVTFSSWTVDQNLALAEPRNYHSVLRLGSSLVVVGGGSRSSPLKSVEVLNTKDSVSWYLPEMIKPRDGCSMVATSIGIVVIGGNWKASASSEILPLITKQQQLKVWQIFTLLKHILNESLLYSFVVFMFRVSEHVLLPSRT